MTGIASFKYTPSAPDSWGKAEDFFVGISIKTCSFSGGIAKNVRNVS